LSLGLVAVALVAWIGVHGLIAKNSLGRAISHERDQGDELTSLTSTAAARTTDVVARFRGSPGTGAESWRREASRRHRQPVDSGWPATRRRSGRHHQYRHVQAGPQQNRPPAPHRCGLGHASHERRAGIAHCRQLCCSRRSTLAIQMTRRRKGFSRICSSVSWRAPSSIWGRPVSTD